jgi:hypothetical protein
VKETILIDESGTDGNPVEGDRCYAEKAEERFVVVFLLLSKQTGLAAETELL